MQHPLSSSDRRDSSDPIDDKIDELLRAPIAPPPELYQKVMQRLNQEVEPAAPAVASARSWQVALLGLAAMTVAGVFAFYTLFTHAPTPHVLASTSTEAPLSSEILPVEVDELLLLEEMLQPTTHLASMSWDTIEALIYQ